jgi:tripartite-type tricarboxylate transporter receptor subunit TctC
LREGVLHVIAQPKVREAFERLGAEVIQSSPDDFARRVKADYDKWVRIRKETGIKVD